MSRSNHLPELPGSISIDDLGVRKAGRKGRRRLFSVTLIGRPLCTGTRSEIHRFLRTNYPALLQPYERAMRRAVA